MAIIDPYDELAVRVATGLFIEDVDQILPASPIVSSHRLGKRPPGWAFNHPKSAHKSYRRHLSSMVQPATFCALLVTDVRQCYPSITYDVCGERLLANVANQAAVRAVMEWLSCWGRRDGLRGLPIGPEWSPVYAHAMLGVLDRQLLDIGAEYARWSDDLMVFLRPHEDPEVVLSSIDAALEWVCLERSGEKTEIIDDIQAARNRVQDAALSGLQSVLAASRADCDGRIHELFDAVVGEENPTIQRFRFAVRTMENRGDPWAADRFALEPSLMEVDPTTVGTYLKTLARSCPDAVATLLPLLSIKPTDRNAGVQLHLMRASTGRMWGRPEGELFEAVSNDAGRSPVLRWWAAEALAATPTYDVERCMSDVESAQDSMDQRRHSLPIRRSHSDRQRRRCARRLIDIDRRLTPTARFIERSADFIS